jgi:hypothetical protein
MTDYPTYTPDVLLSMCHKALDMYNAGVLTDGEKRTVYLAAARYCQANYGRRLGE